MSVKLRAPQGASETNIDGTVYKPDKKGFISVEVAQHLETLKRHGYVGPDEDGNFSDDAGPVYGRVIDDTIAKAPVPITVNAADYPLIIAALNERGVDVTEKVDPLHLLRCIESVFAHFQAESEEAIRKYAGRLGRAGKPQDVPESERREVEDPTLPAAGEGFLLGSSILPAHVEILQGHIGLGDIVRASVVESGLSTEDWNALPDADREAKLQETVDRLRAEAKTEADAAGGSGASTDLDAEGFPTKPVEEWDAPTLKKRLIKLGVSVASGTAKPRLLEILKEELARREAEAQG
jgi:hypothetical protein